jgi:hypothetical protein
MSREELEPALEKRLVVKTSTLHEKWACRPSKGNEKRREEDKIGEEKRRKVKVRRTKS